MKEVQFTESRHKHNCFLGSVTSPVNIKISENATSYHVNVARRVPIPLLPKVESELRRMERDGVIKNITERTRCAPMVAALKKPDNVSEFFL